MIEGPGKDSLTIDAMSNGRILNVNDGSSTAIDVTVQGVTLTGGRVTESGGAIENHETLVLSDVSILGNEATSSGGGIWNSASGSLKPDEG